MQSALPDLMIEAGFAVVFSQVDFEFLRAKSASPTTRIAEVVQSISEQSKAAGGDAAHDLRGGQPHVHCDGPTQPNVI